MIFDFKHQSIVLSVAGGPKGKNCPASFSESDVVLTSQYASRLSWPVIVFDSTPENEASSGRTPRVIQPLCQIRGDFSHLDHEDVDCDVTLDGFSKPQPSLMLSEVTDVLV